jgi:hypothetical protein
VSFLAVADLTLVSVLSALAFGAGLVGVFFGEATFLSAFAFGSAFAALAFAEALVGVFFGVVTFLSAGSFLVAAALTRGVALTATLVSLTGLTTALALVAALVGVFFAATTFFGYWLGDVCDDVCV